MQERLAQTRQLLEASYAKYQLHNPILVVERGGGVPLAPSVAVEQRVVWPPIRLAYWTNLLALSFPNRALL